MGLVQLGEEVTSQGPDSCLPSTCEEVVEKMKSGSAQCCMVGGKETMVIN